MLSAADHGRQDRATVRLRSPTVNLAKAVNCSF